MGLLVNQFVEDDCLLGIWEIRENYDELISQLQLTQEEIFTVESFRNYQRRLEWLSVRVLINQLLNRQCRIVYNGNRKPFLECRSHQISISHSHELTSVLMSKNFKVGIDLEFISHQIQKVSHKFINDKEYITPDVNLQRIHLYIHWCAKEALYKICDKQDINFKKNLTIQPFEVAEQGIIIGFVDNKRGHEEFILHYSTFRNYVMVWCKK